VTEFLLNIKAGLNDYFGISIPKLQVIDVVEMIIIAFFIYQILKWIKSTRAWMLFKGIIMVLVFFVIAGLLHMSTILWLGEKLVSVGMVALVVVFQPELRKALEQLGRKNIFHVLFSFSFNKSGEARFSDKTVNEIVKACYEMGAVKTGALIVVEQEEHLNEYIRTGIMVDAVLTRQLLINIFEKNTPLHDGAVIVRGDRVIAATCYLPLTDNLELSKDLGTRHRAAVGISEVSDALTIVVSEETGQISVTMNGVLRRDLTPEELTEVLKKIMYVKPKEENKNTEEENPIENTGRLPEAEAIDKEMKKVSSGKEDA
jgi:diadenylate cyclase